MTSPEVESKECSVCKKALPLFEFRKRKSTNKDATYAACKACSSKYVVAYNKKHPEKRKIWSKRYRDKHKDKASAASKAWLKAHPEKVREYAINGYKSHLKNKYGISIEDYDEMYIRQGGCCGICGTHQSKLGKRFCIDHDHDSGGVRGLLCDRCNTSIGKFEHNICLLKNAIRYLEMTNE